MNKYDAVLPDLFGILKQRHLWLALGWNDVRARYRRSTLGPWWLTISMAVTVGAMGPLYGALFNHSAADFIPHLALGMIFWAFISSCINESCNAFSESAHYLRQMKLPLSIFISRVCYRQLIILCHNILIYPVIMILLGKSLNWNAILFIPGLILTSVNVFCFGFVLSIFCTRYRDMQPVVNSVMALMFFITPIIWQINQLPEARRFLADINPFSSWLEIMRIPILGGVPDLKYWLISFGTACFGAILTFLLLLRCKHRVTYWL